MVTSTESSNPIFFGNDLFYIIRAQHVLRRPGLPILDILGETDPARGGVHGEAGGVGRGLEGVFHLCVEAGVLHVHGIHLHSEQIW